MSYWKKRFEALEAASNKYGIETYRKIEPAFDSAFRQIESEITLWYERLVKNNGVTMQEARQWLNANELKEFQWDVQEYIKYGRENAINQQWIKELENASAKYHISRLEALKVITQQAVEVEFGNELDEVDAMVKKIFTNDYYHSIYEMQKGFNIGWEIGQIDERKLEKIVSSPWATDGKHFSERIWNSRTQLVSELHNQLTRTCILGKPPDDAIKAISKKFNTSKNQAGRLVMTEQAYFHSVAQQEAFKELDVEEFEVVATLDNLTSEICQEMDGKHFPMKDYEPGVTAPPFHPWCRSVTVPYFDDDFDVGERAARNEDGETYYVPGNMTYKEWKKSFVNGDKSGLQETTADKYVGMSFMDKKEKIYTNEQEIERLYEQKKDAELQILTGSSITDIEDGQKKATAATSRISELKTENETLQQSLGLPTNAKERFYNQNVDYSKLPCDVRESELGAVGSWTRTDYTFINRYLRNDDKGVRSESIQNAEILKNMIDRNIVSEPFTVKRGTDFTAMNRLFGSDAWKKEGYNVSGKIIMDPGFFATTPDLHGGFGGGIQMYIDIPSGTKGVYLGDLSAAPDEKEFLLQCGTEFIVDKIEIQYNKWGEPLYDVYMKVKVK